MFSFGQPASFALAIYESQELVWHSSGLRLLELGRQVKSEAHDEPRKYGLVDGAEPLRLVIADNSEPTISRHQLRLQIGDEGLSVANTSRIRPVACNGQPLSPESKIHLKAESVVRIDLPGRIIAVGPQEADVVTEELRGTLPSDDVTACTDPPLHDDFSHGVPAILMPMTDEKLATLSPSQRLRNICESLRTHQIVLVPHSRSTCAATSIANLEAWLAAATWAE